MPEEAKPKIGLMFRGQAWVELNGTFYAGELHDIANQIERNCMGMDKNDNKK